MIYLAAVSMLFLFIFLPPDMKAQAGSYPYQAFYNQSRQMQPSLYVYEFSAKWCPSCQKLKPYIERIVANNSDLIKFTAVDVDSPQGKQMVESANIQAIPAVVVTDSQGRPLRVLVGFDQGLQLEGVLNSYRSQIMRNIGR